MKKKIISITLLITLLFGLVLVLTGCGEKDNEEKDSPMKVVKEAVKAIEKLDYDGLIDCFDLKAFYVIHENYLYYEEDLKDFEKEYEELSASEWKRVKKEMEEEIEEEWEEFKEEFEDYDSVKIKIDSIDYEKVKDTKKVYKVELKLTATATYDGQADKESGELDVYVCKFDGEYKIINVDF